MDDNTLDNAGPVGRDMADSITEKLRDTIEGFPGPEMQRAAIARIISNNLSDIAEELDR